MSNVKRRKLEHGESSRRAPQMETSEESATLEAESPEPASAPAEQKTFKELGITDSLCEACEALNYKFPTPIQAQAIPHALEGRDVIGLAETGSGKTAAFALPMLQALLDKPQPFFGLILAPTRELAAQIGQAFEALGSAISLRCAVIVGGLDMVPQAIALGKKPHIIVATPGRLVDHLEKTKGFSLARIKYLVLDEADRLLDMDFGPSIDKILKFVPRERNTFLFSATMSSKVKSLQRASLRDPVKVSVSESSLQVTSNLVQRYIFIPLKYKNTYFVHLVNEFAGKRLLVFTRTVFETQRIAIMLRLLGFGAIPLHGQLSQQSRMGALAKFRRGDRNILCATDVVARGIDIPNVDVVINFDLAQDSKTYVHRVGRTARAGKSGLAINVVTQYDIEIYQRTEFALGGVKLPEHPYVKEEAMAMHPRVEEAKREAKIEMKNKERDGPRGRNGGRDAERARRHRDRMDLEER